MVDIDLAGIQCQQSSYDQIIAFWISKLTTSRSDRVLYLTSFLVDKSVGAPCLHLEGRTSAEK